jgi:ribosomal protein S18 acetylase RimI-like enzyme
LSAAERAALGATGGDIADKVERFLWDEDMQAKANGKHDWEHFDGLVMLCGGKAVAFQRYDMSDDGKSAYADGIWTGEDYKRMGLAKMLREVLYSHLQAKGAQMFRIRVKNSTEAKGLADSDARDYGDAIVDLGPDPLNQERKMYGVDLKKVELRYDTSKAAVR